MTATRICFQLRDAVTMCSLQPYRYCTAVSQSDAQTVAVAGQWRRGGPAHIRAKDVGLQRK